MRPCLRKCGRTFCAKMRNLAVCLRCKRIKLQNGVVVRQKKNMRLKRLKIPKIKYYTKNRKKLCIFNFFVYLCAKLINQLVMAEIKKAKVSDLVFDDKNFNRHTEFGMSLLEKSLRQNGAGRSILIDKNNRIIGGNGVVEVAGQIGLDDVQIVESDGTKIIAVKRTDIDLDSKQGREMALADNATGAADLQWDADTIADVSAEFDIDVSGWGVNLDYDTEEITSGERDNTKGFVKVTLMLTDIESEELDYLCQQIDDTKEIAILTALREYGKENNTQD